MMTQAFYTGLSGLVTSQSSIDVTADNLANVNTVGYRSSSIEFASLFEDSINSANGIALESNTVGVGSRVQGITTSLESGAYQLTDRSTDIAINGDGWFGVQAGEDTQFTRAGSFLFDVNNDLVTPEGMYVLGTMAGNIEDDSITSIVDSTALSDVGEQEQLRFPKTLNYPAEPTTTATFTGNIGVENTAVVMSAGVVDALGVKNNLQLTFTKSEIQPTTGSSWDVSAVTRTIDKQIIDNETAEDEYDYIVYDTQTGTVTFDEAGGLLTNSLTTIDNNGAAVEIDLGTDFSGVVSSSTYAASSSTTVDGTIGGDLAGYDINENGEVIATFTNGEQSSVGRIAVYHFQNDQGLERLSGANFMQSSNSGEPLFYQDADGNNILGAQLSNYKLESSNVNMEVGMTDLIIQQRSYDANSKSITTADEMIQKALDMDA